MDWEKYTGKKSKPREYGNDVVKFVNPSGPETITITDPGKRLEYVDDHTVRIVDVEKRGDGKWKIVGSTTIPDGGDVVGTTPEPLPSFDEVWETVQARLEARAYDGLPLQQAVVAMVKDVARVMYETLTQEQNDE